MQLNRIVAVFACLCPLAPAQTDAGLWRFVHPNAKALIGIDVHRIRTSQLVTEMTSQLHGIGLPVPLPLHMPGMDMINTVDRVIISSPGRNPNDPNQEPPLLIAISGQFEPGKLGERLLKAGARRQVFESVTIYRLQEQASSDFGFVVLNSQTLLIGDVKSLFAIIERVGKGAAAPPGIVERARDLDIAYDFWAILLTPPSAMASDRFPITDMAEKLNGFEAGIAVRNGLIIDVNFNTTSEAAAKAMSAQLSKFIHLAAKDRENHPEFAGLDRKVKFTVDRSDLHLALHIDTQDTSRLAKAFSAARAKRQGFSAQAIEPPSSEAPVKQLEQKQVIRIEGLDGGPREIPYRSMNK